MTNLSQLATTCESEGAEAAVKLIVNGVWSKECSAQRIRWWDNEVKWRARRGAARANLSGLTAATTEKQRGEIAEAWRARYSDDDTRQLLNGDAELMNVCIRNARILTSSDAEFAPFLLVRLAAVGAFKLGVSPAAETDQPAP